MRLIFIFLISFSVFITIDSQETPTLTWQFGMLGQDMGKAGILTNDIDKNGFLDIISSGTYPSYLETQDFIHITEYNPTDSTFCTKRIGNNIFNEITALQGFDFDKDESIEIYAGLDNGQIVRFNSSTLNKEKVIELSFKLKENDLEPNNKIICIEFADINKDSEIEMIVSNSEITYILNENFDVMYKLLIGSDQILVGDIDADDYNEIVFSNGTVIQVGENKLLREKPFHARDENMCIELMDMNNDNTLDIIYTISDSIRVYNYKLQETLWTKIWETRNDLEISGLWLFDANNDGIADVFVGNWERDGLYGFNGLDGAPEFSYVNFENDGITEVIFSDLDNDSQTEVLWTSGFRESSPDYYLIYNVISGTKEWQSKSLDKDYKAIAVGDVDNDGITEIVSGIEHGIYGYDLLLSVINAENNDIEWQDEVAIFSPNISDYTALTIGDVDNDNKNELLLGVELTAAYSYVYILDSNYTVERKIEMFGMDRILDMEIADLDNDGKNELIVTKGTQFGGMGDSEEWNNYIHVFDGETGNEKWKSEKLASNGSNIGSLRIGNIDNDESKEIVALNYSQYFSDVSELIIIDGSSFETTIIPHDILTFTAIDIADINNDSSNEILIGTETGDIIIVDGNTLNNIDTLHIHSDKINALRAIDLDEDKIPEIIYSDKFRLNVYDVTTESHKWQSDIINSNIGEYNSLIVQNIDNDDEIEILLNGNHTLNRYDLNYSSLEWDPIKIDTLYILASWSQVDAFSTSSEPSSFLKDLIHISPNPTTDCLKFEMSSPSIESIDIVILNLNGQEIYRGRFYNHGSQSMSMINTSFWESGIYTVSIILNNDEMFNQKIIKL